MSTTGNVPLSGVTVSDSISGVNPVPVLSGGNNVDYPNSDGLLEAGETWVSAPAASPSSASTPTSAPPRARQATPAARPSPRLDVDGYQPRQLLRLHDEHQHRQTDQRQQQRQCAGPVRAGRHQRHLDLQCLDHGQRPALGRDGQRQHFGSQPRPGPLRRQ